MKEVKFVPYEIKQLLYITQARKEYLQSLDNVAPARIQILEEIEHKLLLMMLAEKGKRSDK